MSEPWTPGPWDLVLPDGAEEEFFGHPYHAGPAIVFGDEWYGRMSANAEADARLIAAAPEMAELLRRSRDMLYALPGEPERLPGARDLYSDAAALLSRIRGEAETESHA